MAWPGEQGENDSSRPQRPKVANKIIPTSPPQSADCGSRRSIFWLDESTTSDYIEVLPGLASGCMSDAMTWNKSVLVLGVVATSRRVAGDLLLLRKIVISRVLHPYHRAA